jgi:hypothetical protein
MADERIASEAPPIAWAKRNPQKVILLTGVVLFAIMGVFPPWKASDDGGRTFRPTGYEFIGGSPQGRKERQDQLRREVEGIVTKANALYAKRLSPPSPYDQTGWLSVVSPRYPGSLHGGEVPVSPATPEETRLQREIEVLRYEIEVLGWHGMHIDLVRLIVQWGVLAVVVGGGVVLTKPTRQGKGNKDHAGNDPSPTDSEFHQPQRGEAQVKNSRKEAAHGEGLPHPAHADGLVDRGRGSSMKSIENWGAGLGAGLLLGMHLWFMGSQTQGAMIFGICRDSGGIVVLWMVGRWLFGTKPKS